MTTKFTPSVVAPLEFWDDSTDSIVFLIEEKKELHVDCAELALDQLPEQYHGSRRFVTPENCSADLEGWQNSKEVRFSFTAKYADVVDPKTGEKCEGYNITVELKFLREIGSKKKQFGVYSIAGLDRRDFRVVSEKLEA